MRVLRASVVLATFNGAKYVEKQLASLAEQTHLPSELIVSDDASSDATLTIIEQFAQLASFPVRIFVNPEKLGYAQNFGIALTQCAGDIVFLCDQDDFWLPEKIETMLHWFEQHDEAELLIHDLEFCREDLTPIGETKMQRMSRLGNVDRDYVVGMATAIRSRFLRHCLPIPREHGLSHDRWLHMCAESVDRKRLLPAVLALHRRHATNVTINNPVNAAGRVSVLEASRILGKRFLSRIRNITKQPSIDHRRFVLRSTWLSQKKKSLVAQGCISAAAIERLIAEEEEFRRVLLARQEIWELPHWRRILPIFKLVARRRYQRFYRWWSPIEDLFVSRS